MLMRLKYDPSILTLQLVDAGTARRVQMTPGRLGQILAECRPVESLRGVHLRGIEADPGELPNLVELGRMIALAGFPLRVLQTSGQGMLQQEAEEVLRAFTSIEFQLPRPLRAALAPFHETIGETAQRQLNAWLAAIEYYARVKQTWQLSARLIVRLPQGNLLEDLPARLDRMVWRSALVVERSADAAAFTLGQQQAEYGMKLCEEPYRVITFSASGQLTTCSGDQRQRVYFGSLDEDSLRGLWEGSAIEAWRRSRALGPCQGCPGLGTTLRRPSLIGVYDSLGEQRFHEYPERQLCRIAQETETRALNLARPVRRTAFLPPRRAS